MLPKLVPGDPPSEEKQLRFIEKYKEIRQFSNAGVVVLFCDAMHLIHQTEPAFCWGNPAKPPVFKTNSGRKRLNILGAYNPAAYHLVHNTTEANCDSEQVIIFFEKILRAYPNAHSIVLILDNAPYFHSEKVREWLDNNQKIICFFLPPYAPNLNLIERLWHFAKEKLVKNEYYKKYKTFRCNAFRLLNHVKDHVDELETLISEKFEIVREANIIPCKT